MHACMQRAASPKRCLPACMQEVLTVAVSPGMFNSSGLPKAASEWPLPELLDGDDLDRLERLGWIAFEQVLVIQDRWDGRMAPGMRPCAHAPGMRPACTHAHAC